MRKKILLLISILICFTCAGYAQNQKNITTQIDSSNALTEKQEMELHNLKVEAEKNVMVISARLAAVSKKSNENMLAEKPDTLLNKKLSDTISETIGELLQNVNRSGMKGAAVLTAKQRALIKKEMDKPGANGDVLGAILKYFEVDNKNKTK